MDGENEISHAKTEILIVSKTKILQKMIEGKLQHKEVNCLLYT